LSSSASPLLIGILNITEDSFSDGARYLDPAAALAQARRLVAGGADIVELGAAASNVAAKAVPTDEEIRRLDPLIARLKSDGVPVSIDTFQPETQRFALARGIEYLNDIQGFPDPAIYPDPYAFQPERFLEEPPGTYTWIPFGGGRRRCLGASFALLEMKIVLRAVLAHHDVAAAAEAAEATRRRSITFSPGDGAVAVLRARARQPVAA